MHFYLHFTQKLDNSLVKKIVLKVLETMNLRFYNVNHSTFEKFDPGLASEY